MKKLLYLFCCLIFICSAGSSIYAQTTADEEDTSLPEAMSDVTYARIAAVSDTQRIEKRSHSGKLLSTTDDLARITDFCNKQNPMQWASMKELPKDAQPKLVFIRYSAPKKTISKALYEQFRETLYETDSEFFIDIEIPALSLSDGSRLEEMHDYFKIPGETAEWMISLEFPKGKTETKKINATDETAATLSEDVDTALNALKELDLDIYNTYTDNYVTTYRNWIGIPTSREYRMINELQQPGFKNNKWYKAHHKVYELLFANLEWEVSDIQIHRDTAEFEISITNTDMSDVRGYFFIDAMENALSSDKSGYLAFLCRVNDFDYSKGSLISFMEDADQTMSVTVPASACFEDGIWKLHLNDELITALEGNLYSFEYSDEVQEQLDELEDKFDEKQEQRMDDFIDRITDPFF